MLPLPNDHREPSAEENLAAALAGLDELEDRWREPAASPSRLDPTAEAPPVRPAWLLPRSALASIPAPQPLIDETLDCDSVAVLAGPTGTAKSLLALQWGVAVASGGRWLNRDAGQGSVIFVAAEGVSGLHHRLVALEEHLGRAVPDTFFVRPEPVNLGKPGEVDRFVEEVAPLRPRMIIVDTLARCMVGTDENSAQ